MKRLSNSSGFLFMLFMAPSVWAARSIDEQRPADPTGSVQINSVSGTLEILGWNKPQVEVTGQLGNDADTVDISGDPAHVSVQVRLAPTTRIFGGGSSGARLTIHVPAASSVVATLVSADVKAAAISGDVELHTVSGDSRVEVGGNLKVSSVSGDVRAAAPAAHSLSVRTVSGDFEVEGGDGESDISTVSGTGHVSLGTQSHLHFKSTSGDLHVKLGLSPDARVEGEAVSGDVSLAFRNDPAADFDIQTHSGDIDNCFGPKAIEPEHGPGQRLVFKNGGGGGKVRVVTHSGDVELCTTSGRHR